MDKRDEVKEFVSKLLDEAHELELQEDAQQELHEHIASVQEQLEAEEPEHSLVEDALAAVQRLLESSTTQRATELLAEAGRFLTGVG